MSPTSDDPRSSASAAGKPTLEMLLRVKRTERPDDAFWSDFERGLRQKQLAASIEPRPWWLGFAILGRRVAPFTLPASAGAAALLAVMMLRTEAPFPADPAPAQFATPVANVARADLATSVLGQVGAPVVDLAPPPPAESPVAPMELARSETADPLANDPTPAAATLVAHAAEVAVAAALLEFPPASAVEPTPSQITIAQNLATVRAEEPDLVAASAPAFASLGAARAAGNSDSEDISAPEPAARTMNPRQARLLAMVDTVEHGSDLASVRERMAHRLAHDDTNYGSSSRLGVGGDRFSLSF